MHLPRFGIRDALWATTVIGLTLGWWIDRRAGTELDSIVRAVRSQTSEQIVAIYWMDDDHVDVATGASRQIASYSPAAVWFPQQTPSTSATDHDDVDRWSYHCLQKKGGTWKVHSTVIRF